MRLSFPQLMYIVGLFLVFMLLNSTSFWKLMYPIHYQEEIQKAAAHFDTDPYLILAIVQNESQFKHHQFSKKGATGLMQLMPDTALWANQQSGLNKDPNSYITDPWSNLLLGTWYLSYLHFKYEGDMVKTVAAYNAGQGNVDRWLAEGIWDGTEHRIDQIPFGETRHYISRVIYYYHRYAEIYKHDFLPYRAGS